MSLHEFRWQILARWVTAAVLALGAIVANTQDYVESVWPLFCVCAGICVYNLLISATGLLRARPYRVTLISQILDLIALTVFLHYSGDLENPLMFAYSLPVVAGTVIVSKRSGFWLAGCGSLLFLTLVCATLVDAFPIHLRHYHLNLVHDVRLAEAVDPDITNQGWDYILTHVVSLTAVLFGSAYGFGTLSERIREKDAELMHQSKMADVGLLAAGIAHEIGNPLSSISAILQLIEMRQSAPELSERLRAVRSHVERMNRILQDVRDFTRPSSGRRSHVAVRDVIEKALQIFRLHERTRRMAVTCETANGAPAILAVEDQIVQVLLNLLLNAADASGGTGTIRVTTSHGPHDVRISVIDRGCGMTREVRQHLFTPFYTTKAPGSGVGLGLFISDSIVRAHGGRIEVESTPGAPTMFTVCLPTAAGRGVPAPSQPPALPAVAGMVDPSCRAC